MANVLIVDDSMFMRQVLKNIVTKAGHEVVGEADSGEGAVDNVKKASPDLVTLDLVMPGMGGMKALEQIKSSNGDVKVVVVSAVGQQQEIDEALGHGAEDYLVKPFDEAKVIEVLGKVLG